MNAHSDRDLVEAAIRGDRSAFADLVERYKRLVVGVAAEVVDDKHSAEDVAQEAFVTAYEKLHALRDGGTFGCWLMRITRRLALRQAHQYRRQRTLQLVTGEVRADREGELSERSKELLGLIQRLPEHERIVVMLKYFEDHSVHEIAGIVGHPVSTVTKRLTRARRRLENWLKENEQ